MDHDFHNIIIRMPNWLGDAVMATPVLADLRSHFPEANLTAMCQGAVSSLLIGNPHLDEIFSFTRPNGFLRKVQNRDLITRLRQGRYDLGILLTNSFSSAWWLWRGHVKNRVGFAADLRSPLLTQALSFPTEQEHLVTTYKRLLGPIGIPLSETPPKLYISDEEREAALQMLRSWNIPAGAKLVGINPGAAFGEAKCWPPERYRETIEKLIQRPDVYVLCFGDDMGAKLVHDICKKMPSQVLNLAGLTTLRELMALIEQVSVLLTNDSGPMHIAAALGRPLVALFGSTNDTTTGPYKTGVVIHKHVSCSPCYKRICPIDFRCMKQISVEEVLQKVLNLLD